MGKRNRRGHLQDECLDKVQPGEPFFVLRAQDRFTPALIRAWISLAYEFQVNPEKIASASYVAQEVDDWRKKKIPD